MSPGTALGFFWALGGLLHNTFAQILLIVRQKGGICTVSQSTLLSWPFALLSGMAAQERDGT